MDPQLAGQLGQGGITAALIFIIIKGGLILIGALKEFRAELVAEIKSLREEIADHTKQDLAAMAEVRQDLASLSTAVHTALDITPIRGVRAATEPGSRGFYGPRKPPREGG